MKKAIIAGLVVVLLAACEDDEGPAGPPGEDFIGQVFEDNVSFDYDVDDSGIWSADVEIPPQIDEVFESDVILTYRFSGSVPIEDGEDADVWEMLPNNIFLPEGTIQYVFNHTFFDVQLIIDGNFNLRDLDPDYTDDQLFRFVVVPADFVAQSGVDIADYEAVVKALGVAGDHQP